MTIKYLIIGLAMSILGITAYFFAVPYSLPEEKAECCTMMTAEELSATEEFANFGTDPKFMALHLNPEAISYQAKGERVTFKTANGKDGQAYLIKSAKPSKHYLFVFHEWWGLNDYIVKEADMWAEKLGVNVMAIDLYDGNVADTREKATEYMQTATTERCASIIDGALAYAGKKAKIATIGWCFGGGWSLQAALLAKKQASGCVIYYGMPEKDVEKLKTLKCDVLGIFAGLEKRINPEVVAAFEANMKAAGKGVSTKIYQAEHAFANPSNPRYDKEAAADAQQLAFDYLKKRMK